jgi:sugar transferase (PEP-CTERM/EpsH1 system associated)
MNGDILFLAHRSPFPPDRGDRIRSWNVLKALAKLARVHLVAFGDDEPETYGALLDICETARLIPHRRSKMGAMLRAVGSGRPASVEMFADDELAHEVTRVMARERISLIYAFSGQMAQYVPPELGSARFLMDFVDVDSEKFAGYARTHGLLSSFANGFEAKRLRAFEASVAQRADLCLFVSEAEADLFCRVHGAAGGSVAALENGVDLEHFNPARGLREVGAGIGPLIVFTGQMDYPPNVDAVTSFANEVLPLIQARQGDARFAIVGRAPTARVEALAQLPGVIVTGEVPDTRPWLAAAAVVVAPLRIARGVQNKVLEAMAMAKPVVASPEAAEGIEACHGQDLLVASSAAAQADAVLSLLHNPERRAALGRSARAAVMARYSWAAKMEPLAGLAFPRDA